MRSVTDLQYIEPRSTRSLVMSMPPRFAAVGQTPALQDVKLQSIRIETTSDRSILQSSADLSRVQLTHPARRGILRVSFIFE